MPDLRRAANYSGNDILRQPVHFEGIAEEQFRSLAGDIISGKIVLYPSLAFHSPYFHRVTDRIIFQITSGVALIEWFDENFDVNISVLFRHPIPTAHSIIHKGWPHECADFLLHSWYVDTQLNSTQVDLAKKILNEGSPLAQHVLDWTLKMLIPWRAWLSGEHRNWLFLTYEQTVMYPERMLTAISKILDLPDIEAMRQQLSRPSRTVSSHTVSHVGDTDYLLGRWLKSISMQDKRELMSIPYAFGIDLYEIDSYKPRTDLLSSYL